MKPPYIVTIVLCGPSDVQKEIDIARAVVERWSQQNFDVLNCGLKAEHWKSDVAPSMEARGQAIINQEMIDAADILVAVFWKRLGTPTGLHDSGTVEEIDRAMAQKKDVLLYFSDVEAPMARPDEKQERKLRLFRERVNSSGFPGNFKSRSEFERLFTDHLHKTVLKCLDRKKSAKKSAKNKLEGVNQTATGSNNLQIVGDGNSLKFTAARTPRVVVTPPANSLLPSEQQRLHEWIEELSILMERVEKKTTTAAKRELWRRLCNKFKVPKYELIASTEMPEVKGWYQFVRRELENKAKRKAPAVFAGAKIRAIKAAMGKMGRTKEDYYPEIAIRLKMGPFLSLKDLSAKDLGRVYGVVLRDSPKS